MVLMCRRILYQHYHISMAENLYKCGMILHFADLWVGTCTKIHKYMERFVRALHSAVIYIVVKTVWNLLILSVLSSSIILDPELVKYDGGVATLICMLWRTSSSNFSHKLNCKLLSKVFYVPV